MFHSVGRIMRWAGAYRKRMVLGFVCSFFATWCTAGPVVLAAWALGQLIVDAWGEERLSPHLPWLCLGGIVVLILLRFFFTYWKNRLQESIGTERAAEQRMELGNVLKRVSLGYFAKNDLGDILAALTTELSTLELQSMKMVDAVVNGYIQVAVILLCVAFFCPPAALAALIGVLVSAFALRGIGRQSARTAPVSHRAQEALSGAAIEYIHGLPVVKSFGQDGVSVQRFREACRANKAIRIKNEFGFVPWNCLHLFALRAASVGLVLTAGWQALAGALHIQVAVILLCVAFFCPPAALAALIGVLVSAFALRGIGRQSARTAPVSHRAQEALSGAAIEYIHGLPVVKSFGQDGVSVQRFREACRANKAIRIKNEFGFVPWNCLHLFALRAASVGLVLTAGWQALAGALPLQYFLMIALFSFTIFGSVEAINDAAHILSVTDSVLDRLEELEQTDFIDKGGKEVVPERFDVALSHVSFGYGGREVLHDVSFTAPQGTTTAIVGPSGSGKSTICNLVARFYDVNAGSVSVGGHDVREFTCESLLRNISMVFQTVYLFHDTVENNIKFGCPDATHEQVVAAAKAACCHDFISALPNGYDTVIGEGGSTLSGGEKQRISIARAMLKNAPIVILDEATASVDPENEHLIQQALSALTKGKTILTIAHRLATIQSADQILVVEDGRIVQRGTHDELMAQGGLYRRFIEIREQAEGWRLA